MCVIEKFTALTYKKFSDVYLFPTMTHLLNLELLRHSSTIWNPWRNYSYLLSHHDIHIRCCWTTCEHECVCVCVLLRERERINIGYLNLMPNSFSWLFWIKCNTQVHVYCPWTQMDQCTIIKYKNQTFSHRVELAMTNEKTQETG